MKALTLLGAALAYSALSSAGVVRQRGLNPFEGKKQFVNPVYADQVGIAAEAFSGDEQKAELAKKAKQIQFNNPTWTWIDSVSKVPQVNEYLQMVRDGGDPNVIATFVIYNLPARDCGTTKPPGELTHDLHGQLRYKMFIDEISNIIDRYYDVQMVFIIEPGSISNVVSFKHDPQCRAPEQAHRSMLKYAIWGLFAPNTALYLDGGDSATLGWDDMISDAAQEFYDINEDTLGDEGNPMLRGLAVNVGKYNAWSVDECPPKSANKNCDEKRYINALASKIAPLGWRDLGFIIDQGRSGVPLSPGEDFRHTCNLAGAGFGNFPGAPTNDPLADSFIWAKPPGQSDGTSAESSPTYDPNCNAEGSFNDTSLAGSPERGDFYLAYFEQLINNANPPIVPASDP